MKRASALALISVGMLLLSATEGCGSSDDSILDGLPGQNGCKIDAECGGDNPICQAGRCVECTAASQCNVSGQTCDAVTSACKSTCSTNAECTSGDFPLCQPERGVCVRCLGDADCAGGDNSFCDTTLDRCVECRSDADCGSGQPFCDATVGECVECFENSHCGSAAPLCNPGDLECVQCLENSDCPSGQTCNDHECTSPCTANEQCGGERPWCKVTVGECVECLENAHCGTDRTCDLAENQCQ